jgi:hypothetical protein
MLGVQKKVWSRESRSWQSGGSRGGSGGGGVMWRGEERASTGWGAAAQVLGRHVVRGKAARGQRVRGTWPVKRRGRARAETEEERTRGR